MRIEPPAAADITKVGAKTDVGRVRDHNEDAFALRPEQGLFLATDGMGGHRGGELAARVVAEVLPVLVEQRIADIPSGRSSSVSGLALCSDQPRPEPRRRGSGP